MRLTSSWESGSSEQQQVDLQQENTQTRNLFSCLPVFLVSNFIASTFSSMLNIVFRKSCPQFHSLSPPHIRLSRDHYSSSKAFISFSAPHTFSFRFWLRSCSARVLESNEFLFCCDQRKVSMHDNDWTSFSILRSVVTSCLTLSRSRWP